MFRQDAEPEVEVNDEETLALDLSNFPITITVSQVRRDAATLTIAAVSLSSSAPNCCCSHSLAVTMLWTAPRRRSCAHRLLCKSR